MLNDEGEQTELDQEQRREAVKKILKWLAANRVARRVARASIAAGFQPNRKKAKRPIQVERVEQIGELARALGFETHNGLYPAAYSDKLTDEVERDLRKLYLVEEDDKSWQAYCTWDDCEFAVSYLDKHKEDAVRRAPGALAPSTERDTSRLLAQAPGAEVNSFVSEVLASVDLTLKQSPAGEAWPVIGELRCGIAVIGGYNIAIGRCWVQVDGGPLSEVTYTDGSTVRIDGHHGPVAVTWAGGSKQRPVCNVEGLAGLIGRIELPDDFCKVHSLAHEDIVTLRVAVFVGDLERVANDDDGVPVADQKRPVSDSISFRRKDFQTMGKAAKAAVHQVLTEKKVLGGNGLMPLPGAGEGWWVVAEARRRLIDPTSNE